MAVSFDRYEAVRSELWEMYLGHLKHYAAGKGYEGWVTDQSLAALPVGAEPSLVVDRLTEDLIKSEPWFERYWADAWMEAGSAEINAQLATVLSSHGHGDVDGSVRQVWWCMRKRSPRSPDDTVRDLMRRGVPPQAAYETVLKLCQWDNWRASDSARAAEIARKTLRPLPQIEADPSAGWFARLRRGS
ncbi:MAG TPA: hypothetical protein VFJ50_00400 [Gemmatimonadales bacterium]|nr:hypothetical protein [Gemmatimonadales bacterium]